ncbi:MAG: hypothetical protein KC535_03215, partial [Nanoarchaeota archaeon]|nr:hypothetical protein [Nanoarchaeota archaeon]
CNAYATFNFSGSQLTIDPEQVGNCTASFYATDVYGANISSNDIRVDILDLGQTTVTSTVISNSGSSDTKTVTRTITVPIDNDVPSSVRFVFPGISSIYSDGTVTIPFTVKNNWNTEITDILLTFNSSVETLSGELSQTEIASLAPGASVDLNLTYFNYRFEAPFEVNLSADIGSLTHVDTATVFINALEKGSYSEDAVKTRVGFARDLLSDNSECQELNEILISAESETDPDISLKLVNAVIDGCKYLINTQKAPTSEVPKSFIGKVGLYTENYVDYRLLFTIIIGMTLLAVGIGVFSRFNLKKI